MKNLLAAIETHNTAHAAYYGHDAYTIITKDIATDQQIQQLKERTHFEIPAELTSFYQTIGSLGPKNAYVERGIRIANKALQNESHLKGIIESIMDYWGNDRYEFLPNSPEDIKFSIEQISYLNDSYKCIGFSNNHDGLESAGYIYFDKKGDFGQLFYHQDDFEEVYETLIAMTKASVATRSLEDVLIEAVSGLQDYVDKKNK